MSEVSALDAESLLKGWWYYAIEIAPERFTPGQRHPNIMPVRNLFYGMDVKGATCLDIGTMEAMLPVLMDRRQARAIVAYDRMPNVEKVALIKERLKCSFDYLCGFSFEDLRARLRDMGNTAFDIVVFSGVLYHMFDPMSGLARARALVRDGGLILIETAAVVASDPAMFFNASGRFYDIGTSYWFMSTGSLDYLCRYFRLRPLDCSYIEGGSAGDHRIIRLALVCRAESSALSFGTDRWMQEECEQEELRNHETKRNFDEFINWQSLANSLPPVEFTPQTGHRVFYSDSQTLDLHRTVLESPPLVRNPSLLELRLGALR